MKKIFLIIMLLIAFPLFVCAGTVKIGGINHTGDSLSDLVGNWCLAGTCNVELQDDFDSLVYNKTMTLVSKINVDLKGHSISSMAFYGDMDFSISNGQINNAYIFSASQASATLENIDFVSLEVSSSGLVTINNCKNIGNIYDYPLNKCLTLKIGTVTINGGEYKGCVIHNENNLTITSGNFFWNEN